MSITPKTALEAAEKHDRAVSAMRRYLNLVVSRTLGPEARKHIHRLNNGSYPSGESGRRFVYSEIILPPEIVSDLPQEVCDRIVQAAGRLEERYGAAPLSDRIGARPQNQYFGRVDETNGLLSIGLCALYDSSDLSRIYGPDYERPWKNEADLDEGAPEKWLALPGNQRLHRRSGSLIINVTSAYNSRGV